MKKFLLVTLVAVAGFFSLFGLFGVLLVSDAHASITAWDNGYVIVRCTITVGVNVLDTNSTWYVNGNAANGNGVQPGTTAYAANVSSLTVINTSNGAITYWMVHCTTIQYSASTNDPKLAASWTAADNTANGGWFLGTTAGVVTASLMAVFKSTTAEPIDYTIGTGASGDAILIRSTNTTTDAYQTVGGGGRFAGGLGGEYSSVINAGTSGYNWTAPGDVRNMQFRMDMPTAVLDQDWRRFIICVTASTN